MVVTRHCLTSVLHQCQAIDDNHNELHALRERERVATAEAARSEKEVCVLRQELSEAQAAEREKLNVAETNQQDLGAEVALLRVEVQSEREKNVSATEQAEEVLRRQLLAEHAAAVGLLETQAEEQRDLAVNAAMRDCSAKADTTLREELDAQHAEAQREEQEALQKQEQTFRDELCAAEEQLAQRSEQLEQTVLAQTRSEKAHTEQLDAMRKLIASQAAAEEEGSLKAKFVHSYIVGGAGGAGCAGCPPPPHYFFSFFFFRGILRWFEVRSEMS